MGDRRAISLGSHADCGTLRTAAKGSNLPPAVGSGDRPPDSGTLDHFAHSVGDACIGGSAVAVVHRTSNRVLRNSVIEAKAAAFPSVSWRGVRSLLRFARRPRRLQSLLPGRSE